MAVKEKICKECGLPYKSYGIDKCSKMCNSCCAKRTRNRANKSQSKRLSKEIPKFERYVKTKIGLYLLSHKSISCQECGTFITNEYHPRCYGMNVAHIISKGEDSTFYYILENSIFLCKQCHWTLDRENGKSLRIWDELQNAKNILRENKEEFLQLPHNIKLNNDI